MPVIPQTDQSFLVDSSTEDFNSSGLDKDYRSSINRWSLSLQKHVGIIGLVGIGALITIVIIGPILLKVCCKPSSKGDSPESLSLPSLSRAISQGSESLGNVSLSSISGIFRVLRASFKKFYDKPITVSDRPIFLVEQSHLSKPQGVPKNSTSQPTGAILILNNNPVNSTENSSGPSASYKM